jgi:hypothetical protein
MNVGLTLQQLHSAADALSRRGPAGGAQRLRAALDQVKPT